MLLDDIVNAAMGSFLMREALSLLLSLELAFAGGFTGICGDS
jgi:hypothetical protein